MAGLNAAEHSGGGRGSVAAEAGAGAAARVDRGPCHAAAPVSRDWPHPGESLRALTIQLSPW